MNDVDCLIIDYRHFHYGGFKTDEDVPYLLFMIVLFDIRILKGIANIQKFYDSKQAMKKILPHLATRNELVAKETLGFLCSLLLNANRSVQVRLTQYLNLILIFK